MLKPFLLVGVGGSGGKTLRALREMLMLRLEREGWREGWPKAWQMLHIDSPTIQDGASFPYPFLDDESYLSLVSSGSTYQAAYDLISHGGRLSKEVQADALKPLPTWDEINPMEINIAKTLNRAVDRCFVLSRLAGIQSAAKRAIESMSDEEALAQLNRLGSEIFGANAEGFAPEPNLIFISSLAGGTGSGAYLDVIEAVKSAELGKSWPLNSFGILYAPDVFDNFGAKSLAPNALAAMAEIMSGLWITNASALPTLNKETIELYASQGVQPATWSAHYVLGPRYSFLIGRQNKYISYQTPDAVFTSVASSLMSWMIDDVVSDTINANTFGSQAGRPVLPDETRLRFVSQHAPPLSSFGHGKVSLGNEQFATYCEEVLARNIVDRLISEQQGINDVTTNENHLPEKDSDSAWIEFLKKSGFSRAKAHDDALSSIRPNDRDNLLSKFEVEIKSSASKELDVNGTLNALAWQKSIVKSFSLICPDFLEEESGSRASMIQDWTDSIVPKLVGVVERSCVLYGLLQTADFLTRLEAEIKDLVFDLKSDSENLALQASNFESRIAQQFASYSPEDSIKSDAQDLIDALEVAKDSFNLQAEAKLHEVAALLVSDLSINVLRPLAQEISRCAGALASTAKNQNMPDGRESPYTTWPLLGGEVPMRFNPRVNERLLIAPSQYPTEFEYLVNRSVNDSKDCDAALEVVLQVALGKRDSGISNDSDAWNLIEVTQPWIPEERSGRRDQSTSSQSIKIAMLVSPEDYVARARHWIRRPDVAFSRYIDEDLASFLTDESIDHGELSKRQSRFKEEFAAAVAASDPLVDIDATLLMNIHGKPLGEKDSVVSTIPFSLAHPVGEIIKNVLSTYKVWDPNNSPKWFKDTTAKVRSIDIFSMQKHPYHPIVFSSLLGPISKQWAADSNHPERRDAFWKWRRARSLSESIPAARPVVEEMIRGWFVAKVLGQLDSDLSDTVRGPKLSIYSGPQDGSVTFPHPLLNREDAKPFDFLGVVLQSLTIALAQCNGSQTLAPLYAYHRLMDLGGTPGSVGPDLTNWIQSGIKTPNGPEPIADRAGVASGTASERRAAVNNYLVGQKQNFNEDMTVDEFGNICDYPVTWEIREIVNRELENVIFGVSKIIT